jgi:hypothetical protein
MSDFGGDSSSVSDKLTSGVIAIYSAGVAFAALKEDGSVVTWGNSDLGGDSSGVSGLLSSGVVAVYSTLRAFAALKEDESVVTWGKSDDGGDSSSVSDKLTSGVVTIYSNIYAFAALKKDGTVVTWGGTIIPAEVQTELTNIITIYPNYSSFAALKNNNVSLNLNTLGIIINFIESLVINSVYMNSYSIFKSIIIIPSNTNLITRLNIMSTYLKALNRTK